jgi:Rha family phage regulatory protein
MSISKPTLTIIDGHAYCTSLDLAAHFGKRHDHILRDIQTLHSLLNFQESGSPNLPNFGEINAPKIGDVDGEIKQFNFLNFEAVEYTDRRNRTQQMYRLTRDGFALIAMGFTGRKALLWKIRYIAAFNAMEAELRRRSAEAGVIRRAEAQLALFPAFNAALAEQRSAMRLSVAAIQIEAKRVMLPSTKASDLRRLIARGALEGFREPSNGRWMIYEDSLATWLERRKFNAA